MTSQDGKNYSIKLRYPKTNKEFSYYPCTSCLHLDRLRLQPVVRHLGGRASSEWRFLCIPGPLEPGGEQLPSHPEMGVAVL